MKIRFEKSNRGQARLRLRRIGALEFGAAGRDHLQAFGHRSGQPVHFEVRFAHGAADLRNDALAQLDRIAGGLVVGFIEGEGKRIRRIRHVDRLGCLDLPQRIGSGLRRRHHRRKGTCGDQKNCWQSLGHEHLGQRLNSDGTN
jgi:hypothetical protein